MSIGQKIVIAVGAVLFLGMGVYPPWVFAVVETNKSHYVNAGYSLITSPPKSPGNSTSTSVFWKQMGVDTAGMGKEINAQIDVKTLAVQWAVLAVLTAAGFFILKD